MRLFQRMALLRASGAGGGGSGSAGIQFVGGKAVILAGSGSFDFTGLTGGLAANPSNGDYIVISAGRSSNGNELPVMSVVPTGVNSTPIVSIVQGDTVDTGHRVWEGTYEAATASGGSFSGSDSRDIVVMIRVYRGTIGRNGVAAVTAQGNNSSVANPPAVTPTVTGSWIIASGVAGQGTPAGTYTDAADLTNIKKAASATGSTYKVTGMSGDKTDWTAGAFDPASFAGSNSDSLKSWCASTFVIQPA